MVRMDSLLILRLTALSRSDSAVIRSVFSICSSTTWLICCERRLILRDSSLISWISLCKCADSSLARWNSLLRCIISLLAEGAILAMRRALLMRCLFSF